MTESTPRLSVSLLQTLLLVNYFGDDVNCVL